MSASGLNIATLEPGTRLTVAGGKIAVVVDNPGDGTWLVCRDGTESDEEYLVSAQDIVGLA
jgi:hypothetical protein